MTKFYTVYCTTNKLNGRYYIGVHKTSALNDGYLGSGKILKHSIAKYGVAAFEKEICMVYGSAAEAFAKEELLVRVHRRNKLCMNLRKGGAGGFDFINESGAAAVSKPASIVASQAVWRERRKDKQFMAWWREQHKRGMSRRVLSVEAFAIWRKNVVRACNAWTGRHHTDDSRAAISVGHMGSKNSQYGKCWITNGIESTRIDRGGIVPDGWRLGRVISE